MLERVRVVKKGEFSLQELVEELKGNPEASECGALACFVGIVRGLGKDGSKVQKLLYEADEKVAIKVLSEIREEILRKNRGIKDLLMYHVVDELKPGEETVFVVAIGKHRHDAINAVSKAIEEIKRRPPIWKKEFTKKQAYWVSN